MKAEHNEIQQHIGWLKIYAESMTPENWRDMRARIVAQLPGLIAALAQAKSAATPGGKNG